MNASKRITGLSVLVLALAASCPVFAADQGAPQLTIKNHTFTPAELTIPAGQKVKLTVKNEDNEAAEFESFELNREKIVPAHGEVTVFIGPLDAGTYPFFNDFDRDKTQGKIIAK